jgi:dihydrofolate reductase
VPGSLTIAGYVVVSDDGMLADAKGVMPKSIRNDADQEFFQSGLDRAAVVVHGRHSYEGGPRAAQRKRLVLTRQVAATAPNPDYPNALSWNPLGAPLERALAQIGVSAGTVAIIGGPEVFSMFLPRYDTFYLTRAAGTRIPGGRPVFSEVGPHATPEDVLLRHGLKPGARHDLDAAAGVSVTTWQR